MDTSLKRIIAYFIDVLIVSIVVTPFINLKAINPYIEEYNKYYEEYTKLIEDANNGDIDTNSDEYKDQVIDLNYKIAKYKVINSSISVVSLIVYFVIIQYFLKGQTIGKKILKLRVVSNKDKELNIGHYFVRSLILNNIIFSIILIVGVYLFNETAYYNLSMVVSYLQLLVMSVIILMVVLRRDNRGLHDFVAGTKVISTEVINNEVEVKEIPSKKEEKETIEVEVKEEINLLKIIIKQKLKQHQIKRKVQEKTLVINPELLFCKKIPLILLTKILSYFIIYIVEILGRD